MMAFGQIPAQTLGSEPVFSKQSPTAGRLISWGVLSWSRFVGFGANSGPMMNGQTVSRQGMLHEWLKIDPTSPIHKIARKIC
jgi:hypothetical protein